MTQRKTYKDRLRARILDNTGFSNNTAAEASRLSNRDGSYNVRKTGMPFWERYSAMHTLFASEIVCDARFLPMISRSRDGKKTIVDLSKLSSYQLLQET
ncbi:MAG: hypothetical protein ACKO4W_03905 [Bacteroidota bacterium]